MRPRTCALTAPPPWQAAWRHRPRRRSIHVHDRPCCAPLHPWHDAWCGPQQAGQLHHDRNGQCGCRRAVRHLIEHTGDGRRHQHRRRGIVRHHHGQPLSHRGQSADRTKIPWSATHSAVAPRSANDSNDCSGRIDKADVRFNDAACTRAPASPPHRPARSLSAQDDAYAGGPPPATRWPYARHRAGLRGVLTGCRKRWEYEQLELTPDSRISSAEQPRANSVPVRDAPTPQCGRGFAQTTSLRSPRRCRPDRARRGPPGAPHHRVIPSRRTRAGHRPPIAPASHRVAERQPPLAQPMCVESIRWSRTSGV